MSGGPISRGGLALVPAVFARYRDLTRLRYDFPVVLVDRGPGFNILEFKRG